MAGEIEHDTGFLKLGGRGRNLVWVTLRSCAVRSQSHKLASCTCVESVDKECQPETCLIVILDLTKRRVESFRVTEEI